MESSINGRWITPFKSWLTKTLFYLVTASGGDAEMTGEGKDSETVELPCDINIKGGGVSVDYTISWERDGTTLVDGDKYKISNNTLQIFKPSKN